jgi:hypothetical protein
MRIKSFGHNRLEHPFSEVEKNSNLQKNSKLAPFPKTKKSNKEEGDHNYYEREKEEKCEG